MHPALRSFGTDLKATVVRFFAYIGAVAVLAVVAAWLVEPPEVRPALERAPRPDWTVVDRPYHAFSLTAPNLPEADYAIRRHVRGGRKDIMTVGGPDTAGTRAMVEIYRPGEERQRFDGAAAEVAARTTELGGPYPLTPAETLDSKFGRVSVFAFTASPGGRPRNCLGFAHAYSDPLIQIAGWYCKADAEVVDRRAFACMIDGLSLVAAASEPKVQQLFAEAERRRTFCAPNRTPRGVATLRSHDWIEAGAAPALRRSVTR